MSFGTLRVYYVLPIANGLLTRSVGNSGHIHASYRKPYHLLSYNKCFFLLSLLKLLTLLHALECGVSSGSFEPSSIV